MNFISIDFETANDNLLSACALGVVEFENSTMRSENHLLINPPYFQRRLKEENYNIHKIPYDLYSKSSSFKAVWSNLTNDMENIIKPGTVFICFNAIFDVSVLTNLLNKYNLSRDFLFYDPMEVAKNISEGFARNVISASFNVRVISFFRLSHLNKALFKNKMIVKNCY